MNEVFEKTIRYVTDRIGSAGGVFVAIRDGEPVIRECFGMADIEAGRPVTEDSIFTIASDTKAFTTMLVAMLCDEGILDWDKPVRTWWPDFFLGDDYVSAHITLRDMASHRSGIQSHYLLRRIATAKGWSREEYVKHIQQIPLTCQFRYRLFYQNELYVAMGWLLEMVTGKSWEQLVRERIAEPLGMDIGFRGLPLEYTDIAKPYNSYFGPRTEPAEYSTDSKANPCGGIRTNLRGIEKWLRLLIAGGRLPDGTRLVSEKQFKNLYRPNAFWSDPAAPIPDHNRYYGLGLAPSTYRGEKLVYHGGNIAGYRASVGFFPEKNSGYAILINSGAQPLRVLKKLLMDSALGCLQDDYTEIADYYLRLFEEKKTVLPKTPVSDSLRALAVGTWYHPAYEDMEISDNGDGSLTLTCPAASAVLYETEPGLLRGILDNGWPNVFLRFDADGKHGTFNFCPAANPTPTRFEKTENGGHHYAESL